jgi:Tol biopolymer transport system component
VRSLDRLDLTAVGGVHNPSSPFWSPDSQALGFFSDDKLQTVRLGAHAPERIADVHVKSINPRPGGTWGKNGIILYSDDDGKVMRVEAAGGAAREVTVASPPGPRAWPQFLPDGEHFVFTLNTSDTATVGIYESSLSGTPSPRLVESDRGSRAVVVESGSLLFARGGVLLAQSFDVRTRTLSGEPVRVAEGFRPESPGYPVFSASPDVLAYLAHPPGRLMWVDRHGAPLSPITPPGEDFNPSVSPDGRQLVFNRQDPRTGVTDVYLADFATGAIRQLTFGPESSVGPIWSPDGQRIAFQRRTGAAGPSFVTMSASGVGDETVLATFTPAERAVGPCQWTSGDQFLLFQTFRGFAIGGISLAQGYRRLEFPQSASPAFVSGCGTQVSPDGRWIVWSSVTDLVNDGGNTRFRPVGIAIGRLADKGTAVAVGESEDFGESIKWRADGKEIFYLQSGRIRQLTLMAVSVETGTTIKVGIPTPLFTLPDPPGTVRTSSLLSSSGGPPIVRPYDSSPDGQRFVVLQPAGESNSVTVVVNWPSAFKR